MPLIGALYSKASTEGTIKAIVDTNIDWQLTLKISAKELGHDSAVIISSINVVSFNNSNIVLYQNFSLHMYCVCW